MLKDKISPALKNRFLEEIKKSGESNKERGFLLCLSDKGHIYPTRTCEGEECEVELWPAMIGPGKCTGEIQGEFHTHPVRNKFRDLAKEVLGFVPKDEDEIIKKVIIGNLQYRHKEEGIDMTLQTPSYSDMLSAISAKCAHVTKGTSCIGTDIEDDRIECWTMKDIPKNDMENVCRKGIDKLEEAKRTKQEHTIRGWVKPIFDREIINLK